MTFSIFLLIFLSLCAGLVGLLLFVWAVRSGQFEDIEGPKYRMLHDDEEEYPESDDAGAVGEDAPGNGATGETPDPGSQKGKKLLP